MQTKEDIRNAVRDLSSVAENLNLFLDQHQDVESLDAAMNSDDGPRFDKSPDPYRAMHALILARLAKNPEFEKLVARYQAQARNWNPVDSKKLEDLVSYLNQQSN